MADRKAIGIELNPEWVQIFNRIVAMFAINDGRLILRSEHHQGIEAQMQLGDCLDLLKQIADESVAAVITDPPYGCNHGKIGF